MTRARYIQSFSTSGTEHEAIDAQLLGKPYVAYIKDGRYIDWNTLSPTPPVPPEPVYSAMPLTFEILSAGTITYNHNTILATPVYYRKNNGEWIKINNATTDSGTTFNVVEGDIVEFKGNNDKYADNHLSYDTFSGSTAIFNAYGNIMSLVYGDVLTGSTSLTGYAFYGLFSYTRIVSAENLILPFQELNSYSYGEMFSFCQRLTTAPELQATSVTSTSYGSMFQGCSRLNYIKCTMPTAVSQQLWVNGVAATGTFVKHPNAIWETGRDGIPEGWTVVDAEI